MLNRDLVRQIRVSVLPRKNVGEAVFRSTIMSGRIFYFIMGECNEFEIRFKFLIRNGILLATTLYQTVEVEIDQKSVE